LFPSFTSLRQNVCECFDDEYVIENRSLSEFVLIVFVCEQYRLYM
jgi:hypothetical protein